MLSAALVLTLLQSSGGLLADSAVETRHARFITSPGEQVAGSVLGRRAADYDKPIDLMSLEELHATRAWEEENKSSVGGAVALLVVGGLLALVASPILWYAAVFSSFPTILILALSGVATFIVGVVLAIVGIVKLAKGISGNARANRRIRQLDARIEQLQSGAPGQMPPPYQPQPGYDAPPPPPPPPPSSGLMNLPANLVLAEF